MRYTEDLKRHNDRRRAQVADAVRSALQPLGRQPDTPPTEDLAVRAAWVALKVALIRRDGNTFNRIVIVLLNRFWQLTFTTTAFCIVVL